MEAGWLAVVVASPAATATAMATDATDATTTRELAPKACISRHPELVWFASERESEREEMPCVCVSVCSLITRRTNTSKWAPGRPLAGPIPLATAAAALSALASQSLERPAWRRRLSATLGNLSSRQLFQRVRCFVWRELCCRRRSLTSTTEFSRFLVFSR